MRYWSYRRIYYAMERMGKNGERHIYGCSLNLRQVGDYFFVCLCEVLCVPLWLETQITTTQINIKLTNRQLRKKVYLCKF